jgi:hypothetical protein
MKEQRHVHIRIIQLEKLRRTTPDTGGSLGAKQAILVGCHCDFVCAVGLCVVGSLGLGMQRAMRVRFGDSESRSEGPRGTS